MTATDVDAFPSVRPAASRRLPRRAVIAALVALALALAAAGWLGVRSRVDLQLTGSVLSGFDTNAAEPGSYVAEDPAQGVAVAVYVVRNDGPVPATITMSADKPGYTLSADLVRSGDEQPPVDAAGAPSVTLAPGESAGVRLVLGFDCAGTNAGVAYGPNAVGLDVTALGITRQVFLDLDPIPMIRSTVTIPSSC